MNGRLPLRVTAALVASLTPAAPVSARPADDPYLPAPARCETVDSNPVGSDAPAAAPDIEYLLCDSGPAPADVDDGDWEIVDW